ENAKLLKRIIEEYIKNKTDIAKLKTAEKILNEELIIEYHPPFLNRLEFDAFFQKYRIALEVQG
ncbi:3604_t:CDS:2, partial [Racocetra fulgida]